MRPLVVATRSRHKLGEISRILGELPDLQLLDLDEAGVRPSPEEEEIEVFDTFHGNALAKARYYRERAGLPVLADDSGICVDALDGAPGVRSKRFSGRSDLDGAALDRANNELLLDRLRDLPPERRGAHYLCVVALAAPGAEPRTFEGRCDGVILPAPRGSGGFGYDPLFLIPSEGATFAELPPERKNEISHRARALAAARPLLLAGWPTTPSR